MKQVRNKYIIINIIAIVIVIDTVIAISSSYSKNIIIILLSLFGHQTAYINYTLLLFCTEN